jgi:hypothetical protein
MIVVLSLASWLLTSGATTPPEPPPTVLTPDSHMAPMPAVPTVPAQPPERLSMRLLQVQLDGGELGLRQGGQKFKLADLPRLVAAYPDAELLAREANDKLGLANGLGWGGLIATLGWTGTLIGAAAATPSYAHQLTTASDVLLGVSVGLLITSIGLFIAGGSAARSGLDKWLEAVNTYNRQMLDDSTRPIPSG